MASGLMEGTLGQLRPDNQFLRELRELCDTERPAARAAATRSPWRPANSFDTLWINAGAAQASRKSSRAAEMPSMTTALDQRAASRVAPIGLLFLVTASVGWGLNWPVMKFVFSECPPLSARGWAGVIGAAALAFYAVATGVSLKVPADQWPRLIISAILNVALWAAVMSYALL